MVAITSPATAPIVILVFDNNGEIEYRAFSPSSYKHEDISSNNKSDQFNNFIKRVHSAISLRNTNDTIYGRIYERNYRFLPNLLERGDICYFTLCRDESGHYKSIDIQSPIHFTELDAVKYARYNNTGFHRYCMHYYV
jgi:hypothetical protein